MTHVATDLRGKRWDISETIGVPITASVTATDADGLPVPFPGVTAFRVYAPGEPIENAAEVDGNVASGTVLTGVQSTSLGLGSHRWAVVDTQTGDEVIAGSITLSQPGVPRVGGGTIANTVTFGVANVTLTGVIAGVTDPAVYDHIADTEVHVGVSANTAEGDIVVWDGTAWKTVPNQANDLFAEVKAGVALPTVGRVVTVTGWSANTPVVGLATATETPYGVVAAPIALNATGAVIYSGLIGGINTSAWTPNTHLWVSANTAGVLTDVPVEGVHAVGFVVEQANNGSIRVLPHTELADAAVYETLSGLTAELTDLSTVVTDIDGSLETTVASVAALQNQASANENNIAFLNTGQAQQDLEIAAARLIADNAAVINDASTTTAAWSAARIIAEVVAQINATVDLAPEALNTLNELAAALNDDPDFAANVLSALAALNDEQTTQDTAIAALIARADGNDIAQAEQDTAIAAAQTTADGKVSKSGDTINGDLIVERTDTTNNAVVRVRAKRKAQLIIEGDSDNLDESDNASIRLSQDGGLVVSEIATQESSNALRISHKDGANPAPIIIEGSGLTVPATRVVGGSYPGFFVYHGVGGGFGANTDPAGGMSIIETNELGTYVRSILYIAKGATSVANFYAHPIAAGKPTAAGHVPQINAYDPATGRRLVDGREEGSTGLRNINVSGILQTGWTSDLLRIERIGASVHLYGRVVAPGGSRTPIVLPSGWRDTLSDTRRPYLASIATIDGSLLRFIAETGGAMRFENNPTAGTIIDINASFRSYEAWPSLLIGTKYSDPYQLPAA